VIGTRL